MRRALAGAHLTLALLLLSGLLQGCGGDKGGGSNSNQERRDSGTGLTGGSESAGNGGSGGTAGSGGAAGSAARGGTGGSAGLGGAGGTSGASGTIRDGGWDGGGAGTGGLDAGSAGQPGKTDGGSLDMGGKVDAHADNPVPDGATDRGAVDTAIRDVGGLDLTADTRDAASSPDAALDGGASCGVCPWGFTCGGGGFAELCGVTVAPQKARVCTVGGWCFELPRPSSNAMNSIFARTANDIWAAGEAGTILHFDGSDWSGTAGILNVPEAEIGSRFSNAVRFSDVWASGPDDIWVAGYTLGKTRENFVLRGDGTHWNRLVLPNVSTVRYTAIGGTGPSDVWLGQYVPQSNGRSVSYILRWNGSTWTTTWTSESIGTATEFLAFSSSEVYAAAGTVVLRLEGTGWSTSWNSLNALFLWGKSSSSLWTANLTGVSHSIGSTWVTLTPPTGCGGSGLWGTSDTSLWYGRCYFDGSTWKTLSLATVTALHGPKSDGAVAALFNGQMVDFTATTATPYRKDAPTMKAVDVGGTGPTDIWVAGSILNSANLSSVGAGVVHWDGQAYTTYSESTVSEFGSVNVLPGSDVWAGNDTSLWRLSGGRFTRSEGGPGGTRHRLWAAASDAIWAVTGSDATIAYFDGQKWKNLAHPLASSTVVFKSIWGSGANDIWVAGTGGITQHWDGSVWTAFAAPGALSLIRIWGSNSSDLFTASADTHTFKWTGSEWIQHSTPTCTECGARVEDYASCSNGDIWASFETTGDDGFGNSLDYGQLAHFNGQNWHVLTSAEIELSTVPHVFCAGAKDAWLVDGSTRLLRHQMP